MSNSNSTLTQSRLKELLHYDPDTGLFKWTTSAKKSQQGKTPKSNSAKDCICIRVDKVIYKAHRLAWLYAYGKFPESCIDHINSCRQDNRLENLRCATHAENMQNHRKARSDSKSQLIGAMPHQGRWRSDIKLNGKKTYLGVFDTKELAHEAYIKAKREMHPFCTI